VTSRQLSRSQVEERPDDPLLVDGSEARGERRAFGGRVLAADGVDMELPAAFEHASEKRRPDALSPPHGIDEQLDERRRRPVHGKRSHPSVGEPLAACVRRRLMAVECEDLIDAALGLPRLQLVVAGDLERVEACEHVVRRGAGVDLLDVHRRPGDAA
jgi:hypothetical protein